MKSERIVTVGRIAYLKLFDLQDKYVSIADKGNHRDYRKLFWHIYLATPTEALKEGK